MDQSLRRRHLRLWVVIGPMLVIGVVTLLLLRPPSVGVNGAGPVVRVPAGDVP